MTHSTDTGHQRIAAGTHYAREFGLLSEDGPTREERRQIRELRADVARAEAERDTARSSSRALGTENETLYAVLARVVDLVMQGADDPISAALDVLEDAGITLPEPGTDSSSLLLLAVAA